MSPALLSSYRLVIDFMLSDGGEPERIREIWNRLGTENVEVSGEEPDQSDCAYGAR